MVIQTQIEAEGSDTVVDGSDSKAESNQICRRLDFGNFVVKKTSTYEMTPHKTQMTGMERSQLL